jgi:hypothetical protein
VTTDGNELRVGAVRSEPNDQSWSLWGFDRTVTDAGRTETHRAGGEASAHARVGAHAVGNFHAVPAPDVGD